MILWKGIKKKLNEDSRDILKKKHTFFLWVLVHTSRCVASMTMMMKLSQAILSVRLHTRVHGGIGRIDGNADAKMKSTSAAMLPRVRRKLHTDHSPLTTLSLWHLYCLTVWPPAPATGSKKKKLKSFASDFRPQKNTERWIPRLGGPLKARYSLGSSPYFHSSIDWF